MKILKKILIASLLLISACGYKALNNLDDVNFKIIKLSLKGNKQINSIIKRNLSRFENQDNNKRYLEIKLNSQIKRSVTSKDSTGKDSSFEIKIDINLEIIENKKTINDVNFEESVNYNNLDSQFELKKYERVLIKDLTDQINFDITNLLKTL